MHGAQDCRDDGQFSCSQSLLFYRRVTKVSNHKWGERCCLKRQVPEKRGPEQLTARADQELVNHKGVFQVNIPRRGTFFFFFLVQQRHIDYIPWSRHRGSALDEMLSLPSRSLWSSRQKAWQTAHGNSTPWELQKADPLIHVPLNCNTLVLYHPLPPSLSYTGHSSSCIRHLGI